MYSLIKSIIAYSGTGTTQNFDSYYMYASCVVIIVLLIIFTDFLYRLLRSFIKK